jgi:hypothetical protein
MDRFRDTGGDRPRDGRPAQLEHGVPERPQARRRPGRGARRGGADRERRQLLCACAGLPRGGPRLRSRVRRHPGDRLRRGRRRRRQGPRRAPRDRRGVGAQPDPRRAHALLLRPEGLRGDGHLRPGARALLPQDFWSPSPPSRDRLARRLRRGRGPAHPAQAEGRVRGGDRRRHQHPRPGRGRDRGRRRQHRPSLRRRDPGGGPEARVQPGRPDAIPAAAPRDSAGVFGAAMLSASSRSAATPGGSPRARRTR